VRDLRLLSDYEPAFNYSVKFQLDIPVTFPNPRRQQIVIKETDLGYVLREAESGYLWRGTQVFVSVLNNGRNLLINQRDRNVEKARTV
jgi:hypothetical protein